VSPPFRFTDRPPKHSYGEEKRDIEAICNKSAVVSFYFSIVCSLAVHHGPATMESEWIPTRLSDVQALIQYRNPATLCFQETHLHPAHTLYIRGFTPYQYDHQDGERANGGTAVLVQDHIYSSAVNLRTTLQSSAVHLSVPSLSFSICNIYLPPAVPIDRTELIYLLSQLPSPCILL
jgi:exonuclease III